MLMEGTPAETSDASRVDDALAPEFFTPRQVFDLKWPTVVKVARRAAGKHGARSYNTDDVIQIAGLFLWRACRRGHQPHEINSETLVRNGFCRWVDQQRKHGSTISIDAPDRLTGKPRAIALRDTIHTDGVTLTMADARLDGGKLFMVLHGDTEQAYVDPATLARLAGCTRQAIDLRRDELGGIVVSRSRGKAVRLFPVSAAAKLKTGRRRVNRKRRRVNRKRRPRQPSYSLRRSDGLAVVHLGGEQVYLGRHGTEHSRFRYERVVAAWKANGGTLSPAAARAIVKAPSSVAADGTSRATPGVTDTRHPRF